MTFIKAPSSPKKHLIIGLISLLTVYYLGFTLSMIVCIKAKLPGQIITRCTFIPFFIVINNPIVASAVGIIAFALIMTGLLNGKLLYSIIGYSIGGIYWLYLVLLSTHMPLS